VRRGKSRQMQSEVRDPIKPRQRKQAENMMRERTLCSGGREAHIIRDAYDKKTIQMRGALRAKRRRGSVYRKQRCTMMSTSRCAQQRRPGKASNATNNDVKTCAMVTQ